MSAPLVQYMLKAGSGVAMSAPLVQYMLKAGSASEMERVMGGPMRPNLRVLVMVIKEDRLIPEQILGSIQGSIEHWYSPEGRAAMMERVEQFVQGKLLEDVGGYDVVSFDQNSIRLKRRKDGGVLKEEEMKMTPEEAAVFTANEIVLAVSEKPKFMEVMRIPEELKEEMEGLLEDGEIIPNSDLKIRYIAATIADDEGKIVINRILEERIREDHGGKPHRILRIGCNSIHLVEVYEEEAAPPGEALSRLTLKGRKW